MPLSDPKLLREQRTMAAMLAIYCRDKHHSNVLCPECQTLFNYATGRLERCRYQGAKPTCAKCPVHCYQPQQREQVREMMRYAGPRMLWKHPVLAILHLLDGRREAPTKSSVSRGEMPK